MSNLTNHQQVSWKINDHELLFQSSFEKIYEDLSSLLNSMVSGMAGDDYFYPASVAYQRLYELGGLVESLSKYWSSEQNEGIDIKMKRLAILTKELCLRDRRQLDRSIEECRKILIDSEARKITNAKILEALEQTIADAGIES